MKSTILILGFCVSYFFSCSAQEYEIRAYMGANYYQGDLSPRKSKFSFSPGKLSWAAMFGLKISDVFKLNMKYTTGQLVGQDSDSDVDGRTKRNLSFASPLHEISINTEINLNKYLKGLDKYGIRMYYTTGIGLFHFNPKAFKRNQFGNLEIVDLQPLGTEGQGLPGYGDRYSLTQVNIPFGLGLKFHLVENFEIGIEVVPRWTFTDYIDDVSGAYVSFTELVNADRPIAAMMANRTGEYLGTEPIITSQGAMRGDPNNNDWYFFSGIYVAYNFGADYKKPVFEFKKDDELESEDAPSEDIKSEEKN